ARRRVAARDWSAPASPPHLDHGDLRQGRPRSFTDLAGRCRMSPLRQVLADYLAVRRALGYKLKRTEKLLAQFLATSATSTRGIRTGTSRPLRNYSRWPLTASKATSEVTHERARPDPPGLL